MSAVSLVELAKPGSSSSELWQLDLILQHASDADILRQGEQWGAWVIALSVVCSGMHECVCCWIAVSYTHPMALGQGTDHNAAPTAHSPIAIAVKAVAAVQLGEQQNVLSNVAQAPIHEHVLCTNLLYCAAGVAIEALAPEVAAAGREVLQVLPEPLATVSLGMCALRR